MLFLFCIDVITAREILYIKTYRLHFYHWEWTLFNFTGFSYDEHHQPYYYKITHQINLYYKWSNTNWSSIFAYGLLCDFVRWRKLGCKVPITPHRENPEKVSSNESYKKSVFCNKELDNISTAKLFPSNKLDLLVLDCRWWRNIDHA